MKKSVWVILIAVLSTLSASAFPPGNKDTVVALVVDASDPYFKELEHMSGEQIIHRIDSLLDADAIPYDVIKRINDYAESRLLEHDYYVSLTAYYDSSVVPANSLYKSWDNYNIYPYEEELCKHDSTVTLVIADTVHYCNYVHPVEGTITSYFGWRDGRHHHGLDIDLQVWDPVKAAFDGMVRIARYHEGYGRVVVIRHYNGLETLYAHLHRFKVKVGDVVEAGQTIGLGGSSGHSTGSHLHYEMRYKGKPLNPKHIVNLKTNELHKDTLILKRSGYTYTAIPKGQKFHTIQRGDFLYRIANRYGMTVNELCELNGIRRNSVLIAGRKLRIKN